MSLLGLENIMSAYLLKNASSSAVQKRVAESNRSHLLAFLTNDPHSLNGVYYPNLPKYEK